MFGQIRRLASHAGSWYPSDKKKLDQQLSQYLEIARNEMEETKQQPGKIRAIIAPHAGIDYSGQVGAYAYCQLNPNDYKRVILLGPSHHVYLQACALSMASKYQTPLGDIIIDKEANEDLLAKKVFKQMNIKVDEAEHSLELHLPYIKKVFGDKIKLLPIMVGNLTIDQEKNYGQILSKYLTQDQDSLFIISTDFCHWGKNFDYMYLTDKVDQDTNAITNQIEKLDKEGIQSIIEHQSDKFNEYLDITSNTICGQHPIKVFLECVKASEGEKRFESKLVKYGQSEQIIDDKNANSVSYASIITREIV